MHINTRVSIFIICVVDDEIMSSFAADLFEFSDFRPVGPSTIQIFPIIFLLLTKRTVLVNLSPLSLSMLLFVVVAMCISWYMIMSRHLRSAFHFSL